MKSHGSSRAEKRGKNAGKTREFWIQSCAIFPGILKTILLFFSRVFPAFFPTVFPICFFRILTSTFPRKNICPKRIQTPIFLKFFPIVFPCFSRQFSRSWRQAFALAHWHILMQPNTSNQNGYMYFLLLRRISIIPFCSISCFFLKIVLFRGTCFFLAIFPLHVFHRHTDWAHCRPHAEKNEWKFLDA